MNGGGSFHCIPDVDDDCISDSQVNTHGALLFSSTTTYFRVHLHINEARGMECNYSTGGTQQQ